MNQASAQELYSLSQQDNPSIIEIKQIIIILHQQALQMKKFQSSSRTRKYSTFQYERTTYVSSADDYQLPSGRNLRKVSGDLSTMSNNYKTEVCKYWQAGNQCSFRQTCIFAHGNYEMRSKDYISDKYKTKLCKNFHEKGFCSYGKRCQFIHNNSHLKNVKLYQIFNWFGNQLAILNIITRSRRQSCINSRDQIQSSCSITISIQQNRQNYEHSRAGSYQNNLSINLEKDMAAVYEILQLQQFTKPRLYSL